MLFCLSGVWQLSSCKKNHNFLSNASVIGVDYAMCPCCGGFKVHIDGVGYPPGSSYFLADGMPAGSGITDSSQFPIRVKIAWKMDTLATACTGRIDIISLIRE